MHGLIIRSFEYFLRRTYGAEVWDSVFDELDPRVDGFEPMFHYDDGLARRVVTLSAKRLDKPREVLLEDFGTYLVAHPASERVRRLLRFGGVDYEDFLASLEDLSGRARLAVPDLDLPKLELSDPGNGEMLLRLGNADPDYAHALVGLLRALADDYGALVIIEMSAAEGEGASLTIRLLEADFSEGKGFALAQRAAS